jgi:hypothetical protein
MKPNYRRCRHWALLLVFGFLLGSSAAAEIAPRPFLFKDSRAEVAKARAAGLEEIPLVIASMPGKNVRVAALVTELRGQVQYRDDDVDYLRVHLPLDAVERLVGDPNVHSVDVSLLGEKRAFAFTTSMPSSPSGDAPATAARADEARSESDGGWPPKFSDHPFSHRYSPLQDMRAREFLESHPSYDGRGVRIGMIDLNADPLLPELQQAMTLDGKVAPKIVAYETAIDKDYEDDGRWVEMADTVSTDVDRFYYKGDSYTAPRPGTFRIGFYDEEKVDAKGFYWREGIDSDINRDGNPPGSKRLFAVLWNEHSGDVWVDTNQDLSFADEKVLGDFADRHQFGIFGHDNPDTPVRESIGFAVQVDKVRKRVAINAGTAMHASLVVGAAVASKAQGGRFDGVAPGAALINVSPGIAAYGLIESTLRTVKAHKADVVFFEHGSLITRTYLLRDGRLVASVIFDRLVNKYGVSIVSPTHNYPILGGSDDFVRAPGVIGVGGQESKDSFFTNFGIRVEHDDNLLVTGGYGPMGDGALAPDIIAPSNYVSTARGFLEAETTPGESVIPGLFQMPPGYAIVGGTSGATPTAAGGVALLISAAKQAGIKHDPLRIKYAVSRAARWVPNIPPYQQGNGVINIAGAWEILKALNTREPLVITSTAPVKHSYSHLLAKPDTGVGLFERDGWKVGDSGTRTVVLTRESGPRGAMTFNLSLTGNGDNTFSAPATVTLPLHQAVPVTVTIAPKEAGAHTAYLTLDRDGLPGYAHRVMLTVVAPEELNSGNGYAVEEKAEIPRPGIRSFFFRVPAGATALRVDAACEKRKVKLNLISPDTRQRTDSYLGSNKRSAAVLHPAPGVWEIMVSDVDDTQNYDWRQAQKNAVVPPTQIRLAVAALAVGASPTEAGFGVNTDLWITNTMAAFTGAVVSVPAGSAYHEAAQIKEKSQRVYDLEVPLGSTLLLAKVHPVNARADLDIYLFHCEKEAGKCEPMATGADPVADEFVVVQNPKEGHWKIVVDAFAAPGGSVTYDYLDAVLNPSYGTVGVTDVPQARASNARWMTKLGAWTGGGILDQGRAPFTALVVEGKTKDGETFLADVEEVPSDLSTGRTH